MATQTKPHSCGGCDDRWGGFNTAHCKTCHETFSVVANFDKHRAKVKGQCSTPQSVGLVLNDRGVWAQPDDREWGE